MFLTAPATSLVTKSRGHTICFLRSRGNPSLFLLRILKHYRRVFLRCLFYSTLRISYGFVCICLPQGTPLRAECFSILHAVLESSEWDGSAAKMSLVSGHNRLPWITTVAGHVPERMPICGATFLPQLLCKNGQRMPSTAHCCDNVPNHSDASDAFAGICDRTRVGVVSCRAIRPLGPSQHRTICHMHDYAAQPDIDI